MAHLSLLTFNSHVMSYWLLKSDPEEFGWKELMRDGGTAWTGVRNATASNNLKKMKIGDTVLFYESQGPKCIVGLARVSRLAYTDPTYLEGKRFWVAVDIVPLMALKHPVRLSEIKQDPFFKDFALVRQSRLSVMPVTKEQFHRITTGFDKKPKMQ